MQAATIPGQAHLVSPGYAHSIKIDALTRLGEMLKATPKNMGAAAGGKKDAPRGSIVEPRDTTPTLADLGIVEVPARRRPEGARPAALRGGAQTTATRDRCGVPPVAQAEPLRGHSVNERCPPVPSICMTTIARPAAGHDLRRALMLDLLARDAEKLIDPAGSLA